MPKSIKCAFIVIPIMNVLKQSKAHSYLSRFSGVKEKFCLSFALTTPCLVDPRFGRAIIQDEYARILPPSEIHSMPASLPIRLSTDIPTPTYRTLSEKLNS